jgi:ankyrin repeat protein
MDDILRAVREGRDYTVERLLGQDPSLINARGYLDWTLLMGASFDGHVGVVRVLLGKGAAINEQGSYGTTAFSRASSEGRWSVLQLLLERGADPTLPKDYSPLIRASEKGSIGIVHSLLKQPTVRATINIRCRFGQTALWSACFWGNPDVAKALLERGADPSIADEERGLTPMAIAKQKLFAYTAAVLKVRLCLPASLIQHPALLFL